MKILKIFLCAAFIFTIAACESKDDHHYDYPDDDPTTEKGNIGDPCMKNGDCKEGLFCIDKVCSEPSGKDDSDNNDDADSDINDDDTDSGTNDDDTDTDGKDDTDTDTDTGDHDADTDTDEPDKDEDYADDEDTVPDDDSDTEEPVYIPECGNGIRDPGEECDNGLENNDEPGILGITCRTNCVLASCGDNITDIGEECDDGNKQIGDYCSPDCKITGYCGDGIKQNNEVCDSRLEPYCAEDCSAITGYCGDGKKQTNEACDNAESSVGAGEGIGTAYCNINCSEIIGRCGDKQIQSNEECDDGEDYNGRYNYCNSNCTGKTAYCGDGILQPDYEKCDDGNNVSGDYCSPDCQTSYGSCGDGIIQSFEACDKANTGNGIGAYCSDDCKQVLGRCGDGNLNGNEECDYGESGENYNGNLNCPYGTVMPCKVCTVGCKKIPGKLRYCGDGTIQENEICDNAEPNVGDGQGTGKYCSDNCKNTNGSCGDGIVQSFEACDKADFGNGIGTYCSDNCKQIVGRCGDGIPNGNEECDNGETGTNPNGNLNCAYGETSCIVCSTKCRKLAGKTSYCGDEDVDGGNGEICDQGTNNNGHYIISAPGSCNSDCKGYGEGGFCGDSNINTANGEECDNGSDNGQTNCAYGETSCTVCTNSCKSASGNTAYCGDGTRQANEACDKADPSVGAGEGTGAYCSDDCQSVTGYCGDGTVQSNEACDKADPSVGAGEGTGAYCSSDCKAIVGICGDSIIQEGENCDDGEEKNGKYKLNYPPNCNGNCTARNSGYCGDAIKQNNSCGGETGCVEMHGAAEECDYGRSDNGKTNCAYGETSCTVCTSDCKQNSGSTSYCGDGKYDPLNEVCDDGNTINGDYCSSDCQTVTGYCGDGTQQSNEACDDGNTYNGDYCSFDCQTITGECGDGIIQSNETCDKADFGEGIGAYCSFDCTEIFGYCGDGTKQDNEACDDGNNDDNDYCSADCQAETGSCGDGKIQSNEACDKADPSVGSGEGTGAYCSDNCTQILGRCGDDTQQPNEFCEEGDGVNGTYNHCSLDCQYIIGCGDGIPNGNEVCDNGMANGHYGQCNEHCDGYIGYCGDKIWHNQSCGGAEGCFEIPDGEEECDNGIENGATNCAYGETSCTVCTNSCTAEPGKTAYCGDKKIQKGTLEECESYVALDPVNNKLCSDTVTENCCEVFEGTSEACDDGTLNGTFGKCDDTCTTIVTWRCGDGNIDWEHGETCDDGDGADGNGTPHHCNDTCNGPTPYCGDGRTQREDCGDWTLCDENITENCCEVVTGMNEACDDRFMNGAPGYCYDNCSGYCGDKVVQVGYETCDEGYGVNGTEGHCNDTCDGQTAVCGNGTPEKGEFCDDGNDNGKYGKCNFGCQGMNAGGFCGDGIIQVADIAECSLLSLTMCDENTTENCCKVVDFAEGDLSETCDEGGEHNGYHGHCNETCNGISSCGDGVIGKDEACEPGLMGDSFSCSIIDQFTDSGTITECDSNCMPIMTDCDYNDLYTSPFFKTGHTLCYNNTSSIACPVDESDNFYGQEPQFNYTAHNFVADGEIIRETVSGLTWQTDTPAYYGFEKGDDIYYSCEAQDECSLQEASIFCSDSYFGESNGWRLPTAAEFSTIMNYASTMHIYSGFTNTGSAYWTSDGVIFSTEDGTSSPEADSTLAQVKCVRNDSPCTSPQCIGDNVKTILDFPDSLILAYENVFIFWYFGDPMSSETWEDALDFCNNADNGNGFDNMRLPTVNELMSLIDRENGGSLIPGFTGKAWTSTTVGNAPASSLDPLYSTNPNAHAYAVDFSTGSVVIEPKTNNNIVICVE